VNGELIKGHHPVLIDFETFLKANNLLKAEPVAGIAKSHRVEELPLKIFARDEEFGSPLTGFESKKHWYYKARCKGSKTNISATKLNGYFQNL